MAIATGTALALGAAATAGSTVYAANQGSRTARNAQNNQLDPSAIARSSIDLQREYAPTLFNLENEFQPQYAALANRTAEQSLLGTSFFNAEAALAAMDPAQRAEIEAEAARTGYSPAEWLAGHNADQAPRGDPVAQASVAQFGGRSGGQLDIYDAAAPRLTNLQTTANTALREADIADVENLGARATAAARAANPALTAATDELGTRIAAARNVTPGATSLNQATARDATSLQATARDATTTTAELNRARGSSLLPMLEGDAARSLNGVSPLQAELQRQAQAELATGGRLSGEAARDAEQAVRAASEARGLTFSNASIFAEALNKEQFTRQRQAEARNLALGVDAAGEAQRNQSRNYALGVSDRGTALDQFNTTAANQMGQFNAGLATDTSRFNAGEANQVSRFNAGQANDTSRFNAGQANQVSLFNAGEGNRMAQFDAELGRARENDQFGREFAMTGLLQSQAQDPYQLVLGRSATPGAAMAATQAAMPQGNRFQLFDPTVSSIYNTNYNAGQAANISAGNNQAALVGAGISGIGSIFGGYLASRPNGGG